jgi:hypothetical protein
MSWLTIERIQGDFFVAFLKVAFTSFFPSVVPKPLLERLNVRHANYINGPERPHFIWPPVSLAIFECPGNTIVSVIPVASFLFFYI